MISNKQILQLLLKEYGLQGLTLKNLNGHIDKIFLVKTKSYRFVFKISLNRRMNKAIFENQLNLVLYLNKNGINTPKIVKTVNGRNYSVISDYRKRYCVLYEFISGKKIVVKNKKQIIDLAKWIVKIHKLCLNFKGKLVFYYDPIKVAIYKTDYILKHTKRARREFILPMLNLRKKIVAEYFKSISKLRSSTFINDLAQSNIVIKNGKKYILDFNIAGGNYLVDDLSWVLSWYLIEKGKKEYVKDFMNVYQKEIKLNESEKKILRILPILYSNLQYKDFTKIKNKKEVEEKLQLLN